MTIGQFLKLCDRSSAVEYLHRADIALLTACFINAHSKSKTSVNALIGQPPEMSDSSAKEKTFLEQMKKVFPKQKGNVKEDLGKETRFSKKR